MLHAYWYGKAKPFPTGRALEAHLRTLALHGIDGYIPQYALDNGRKYCEANEVAAQCAALGMRLTLGLGLDKGPSTKTDAEHETNVTRALIAAIAYAKSNAGVRVSLDWESWWEGRRAMAARIVAAVLKEHPDAPQLCEDCPWWAPLFIVDRNGRKRPTHPNAPTIEFGALVGSRWVQAYGAQADGSPEGRSYAMLKWSRSPSQYAALGPWTIGPTTQLYARSLNDQVKLLLLEPEQRLWTWNEADKNAILALRVVRELANSGCTGALAVRHFQMARGLTADDIVGPQTLAALGLGPKQAKQ